MGENKLHNYVNYAYRLEIWACAEGDVNGTELLIADSGVGQDRSSDFPVDLHIDNLEMSSYVGLSAQGRNTDVVNFSFDINEPYSNKFLAQIVKVHQRLNPGANWNNCFFALKIKWLGYKDDGTPTGVIDTKTVPFILTSIHMKVTQSGSQYQCKALPTSHQALAPNNNVIPYHMELQGKTVSEIIFGPSKPDGIKCLQDTLNEQEEKLAKEHKSVEIANRYVFQINNSIGNSKVYSKERKKDQNFSLPDPKRPGNWISLQKGVLPLETENTMFRSINGSKITDFINQVVSSSDYVENLASGTFWRVNVDTQFNGWDKKRNDWAKIFIYNIEPFKVKGISPPHIDPPPVTEKDCVRNYNYLWTGLNKDILKLELDFKAAFWSAQNATRENYIKQDPLTVGRDSNIPDSTGNTGGNAASPLDVRRAMQPAHGLANRQNTSNISDTDKRMKLQDIMQYIYDKSVDLVSLELQIVGDPDWISAHNNGIKDAIDFRGSDQYVYLRSKAPDTDYQDNGLFDTGQGSVIQGAYKVLNIRSSFRGGSFTQLLKLIRSTNQG